MTDTTAKVRAKGCDSTGITEAIASTLYANKGQRIMAIIELHAVERHEKADGGRRVDLTIELLEPTTDDAMSEHLRELTRTLYRNRALAEGQLAIDDTLTPSIGDAIAAGAQYRPHPFIPVDASNDNGICDVCGGLDLNGIHADDFPDPFAVPVPDDVPELADPDDPDTHETLPIMGDATTTNEEHTVPTT
jgi:hypothetical protein